jgi:hypothetical protein
MDRAFEGAATPKRALAVEEKNGVPCLIESQVLIGRPLVIHSGDFLCG